MVGKTKWVPPLCDVMKFVAAEVWSEELVIKTFSNLLQQNGPCWSNSLTFLADICSELVPPCQTLPRSQDIVLWYWPIPLLCDVWTGQCGLSHSWLLLQGITVHIVVLRAKPTDIGEAFAASGSSSSSVSRVLSHAFSMWLTQIFLMPYDCVTGEGINRRLQCCLHIDSATIPKERLRQGPHWIQ